MIKNTPPLRQQQFHFDVLDGQRGTAAFMVLLGHASAVMLGGEYGWVPRKGLAVVFFFMLSGFVIASAYRQRICDGMSVRNFMLRRVVRLYPLLVLGVVTGTAWFALFGDQFWNRHFGILAASLNLLGLPSPIRSQFSFGPFPVNPPEWSLFFEMLAYVIFPTLVAKFSNRLLISITSTCAVAYAVSDWQYFNAIPYHLVGFEAGASFCGGLLLWRFFEQNRLPSWRIWQVPSWTLALAIMAVCLCPLAYTCLVDYAALLIVFPAVIILGAAKGRAAANPVEKLLGDLSFPVYILHWPFLLAAHRFIQPVFGAEAAVAGGMISAIAFAWLALRVYDEPFRSWLVRTLLTKQASIKRVAA